MRAYQCQYPDLDSLELLKNDLSDQNLTSTTIRTCLNIFTTVKAIQLTPYKEIYINLINLIENLSLLQVKDKNAMDNLIIGLKNLTQIYFSKLIQATFYEQIEKYTCEKNATKKLRVDCMQLINDYKNEHIDEFKNQWNSFHKLLRFIVNLIPASILSNSKKMTLFFNKEENYKKRISEVTSQLDQLANHNFFSRVF